MFIFNFHRTKSFIHRGKTVYAGAKKLLLSKSLDEPLSFKICKQFILILENHSRLSNAYSIQGVIETLTEIKPKGNCLQCTSQFNLKQLPEDSMGFVCLLVYFLIQHLPSYQLFGKNPS